MARQGWENALDDDMLVARSSSGGFWAGLTRWLIGLFIVGSLTAGTAYYLPLHRAHKALTEQYAAVSKRADSDEADLRRLKAELATAQADRDRLEDEHGQQEAKQKADQARSGQLRDVLAAKLGSYTKSHVGVVGRSDGAAVVLPPTLARMQGAEMTDAGRNSLCQIVKAMSAVGPLTYRVGAFVAHADSGAAPRDQAASRAVSAARTLEDKCAVPGTRILSAGFARPPTSSDAALGGDVLELDVALL